MATDTMWVPGDLEAELRTGVSYWPTSVKFHMQAEALPKALERMREWACSRYLARRQGMAEADSLQRFLLYTTGRYMTPEFNEAGDWVGLEPIGFDLLPALRE